MSTSGLDVFDKSIQTTNIWLDEIMHEMGPDRQLAWHTLGAVLRTLRDRLPADLAAHLGAQLPLIVRGAYYDQYEPAATPDRLRSLDAFLDKLAEEMKFTRPVNLRTRWASFARFSPGMSTTARSPKSGNRFRKTSAGRPRQS